MNKVSILKNGSLLHIVNNMDSFIPGNQIISIGKDNNMEISVNKINGEILSIDCIDSKIEEKSIKLLDNKNLKLLSKAVYFSKNQNLSDFKVYYDKNEINVLIDESANINSYYENDRVKYYYEDLYLANIKITNLTDSEYEKLNLVNKKGKIETYSKYNINNLENKIEDILEFDEFQDDLSNIK